MDRKIVKVISIVSNIVRKLRGFMMNPTLFCDGFGSFLFDIIKELIDFNLINFIFLDKFILDKERIGRLD
jgi:hypothetical protein